MANFVIICDPDSTRRTEFMHRSEEEIAPIPSLRVGRASGAGFGAVWAASPRAPISAVERDGEVAIVWGCPIPPGTAERVTADGLLDGWDRADRDAFMAMDGYYAAVLSRTTLGTTVGADLLGLFPVYYASVGDVTLIASSQSMICHHPAYGPSLDTAGLIGLLLTHGLPGGRTLLDGIRRLPAGHLLHRRPDGRTVVRRQYSIPTPGPLSKCSFEDQLEALGAAVGNAVHRQLARRRTVGLLLSGGRDTRLFAGYARETGCTMDAVTFGSDSDYEVRCARALARELGVAQRIETIPDGAFAPAAQLQARWEHLASGFSTVHTWAMTRSLETVESPVMTGYLAGRVVGGGGMISEQGPFGQSIPFARAYELCAPMAIERTTLASLMKHPSGVAMVDHSYEQMRDDYESVETPDTQRVWRFLLTHFERFHAGAVPWHLSFGSWPLLPILDQELLATVGGMHPWTLANRRAQDQLLCMRFPDLAGVILDRNAHNIDPLKPTLAYRARRRLATWVARTGLPTQRALPAGSERRYYYRLYDLNGAGWCSIRRLAEPYRETLVDIFDMDALRRYVPPPDEPIPMEDGIVEGFGRKLLIGFMLWRGAHGW